MRTTLGYDKRYGCGTGQNIGRNKKQIEEIDSLKIIKKY